MRRLDSWRIRQFAKATGQRAKTGAIDAEMIARFLESLPSQELTTEYDSKFAELQELVSYRRLLVDTLVVFSNRHKQIRSAELVALNDPEISRRQVLENSDFAGFSTRSEPVSRALPVQLNRQRPKSPPTSP